VTTIQAGFSLPTASISTPVCRWRTPSGSRFVRTLARCARVRHSTTLTAHASGRPNSLSALTHSLENLPVPNCDNCHPFSVQDPADQQAV